MSVLHYKAELIRQDYSLLEYRYFPEYVAKPNLTGIFRVDTDNWSWINLVPARSKVPGVSHGDGRCVVSLICNLRKVYVLGQPAPIKIFFIA